MRLKYKLPLILFVAFVAIITITFAVSISGSARVNELSNYETGRSLALARSETVKNVFDIKAMELKALEQSIVGIKGLDDKSKVSILSQLLHSLADRMAVSDVYVMFENGAYFSPHKSGSSAHYGIDAFHPESGGSIVVIVNEAEEVEDDDDWYNVPKETGKLHLTEPYEWTYPGESKARKMITLSMPIHIDGKFVGVAGVDVELSTLQKKVFEGLAYSGLPGSYAILVSHEGLRAVHPKEEMLLVEIGHDMPESERLELKKAIKEGEYYRVVKKNNQTGEVSLISYVAMRLSDMEEEPWSLGFVLPLDRMRVAEAKARNTTIFTGVLCVAVWGVFLLVFMSIVFGSVTRTVEALGRMTEGDGDLTIRLQERGRDEFGMMARGLNRLIEKLHKTIRTTQAEAKNLSCTSQALLGISQELASSSDATLEQSASASGESAEASGNVSEIAAETERASANVAELSATADEMGASMDSVVGAVEDMNASFNKMTAAARDSRDVADKAICKVTNAKNVMDELGAAAIEIGQFSNVIKSIANKTNLLALNATVEAARAGEAGKGFAVVAGEVKQLANQSAQNASDITSRIESIQKGTSNAINAINEVSSIMAEVGKLANSISESIELQIRVNDNLADSAKQTNIGAKQVVATISDIAESVQLTAQNAADTASGVKSVSESISLINRDAKKANARALELKEAANRLKVMSEGLDSIVCGFRT